MTRKLLPYEHQLIEALDVTEEEYLDFLSAQYDYSLSIEDKLATPQAVGIDWAIVALVFTIVGTVAQVAAALLAPKPQTPDKKNQRASRQERFAPRTGFNSAQELGRYGDPVNLVYCNSTVNPTGGVRVGGSLIWSSVTSYGSSQYMETLMLLGAGTINSVDFSRSAFGQTPIRQFATQKTWTYFNPAGNVKFNNIAFPSGSTTDPNYTASDIVYKINRAGVREEGFSQSFSPTTLTTCGVFAPVPIKVLVQERGTDGDLESADLKIIISSTTSSFITSYWGASRPLIPTGTRLALSFDQAGPLKQGPTKIAAEEERVSYLSRIDAAGTYKLGSAKFRLVSLSGDQSLETSGSLAVFECIETGVCPSADYNIQRPNNIIKVWQDERNSLRARNAEIKLIQLNPPPIYDDLIFNSFINGDLNNIKVSIDQAEDWIDAITHYSRTLKNPQGEFSAVDEKLYLDTLANSALSDPKVAELAKAIDDLEDQYVDLEAGWKKKDVKKRIKKLQRQLTRAIEEFGVKEGYVISPRDNNKKQGRAEIKLIRKLINEKNSNAYSGILQQVAATGGGRNRQKEAERDAALVTEVQSNLNRINELDELIDNPGDVADYFNTKCLVKTEEASYQTITDCRIVRFSLKAKVFQRISGRQEEYGENKESKYKLSDNGLKYRQCFFWMWYRESASSQYKRVNYIFVIRRKADQDNFVDINFIAPVNGVKWEFKFEPIAEVTAELRKYGFNSGISYAYIENNGTSNVVTNNDGTQVYFIGIIRTAKSDKPMVPPIEKSPWGVSEWGLFSMKSDTQISYSFENGPEITIAAVTEQRVESLANYAGLYNNLSLVGFNAYSGQGVQDLRSFTVFVNQGRLVRSINTTTGLPNATPNVASNYVPEIFLDTALDPIDGIGQFTNSAAIDYQSLAIAQKFCIVNQLFFDGINSDPRGWRDFWVEAAAYSLLEMARIGGRETLIPMMPVDGSGSIVVDSQLSVTALFNAGNILEDSYKEELIDYGTDAKDLIANVIYRSTETNETFPRNKSVEVRLAGVTDISGFRQTYDLSDYVTSRDQAILFAKFLCQQKRHVKRNVEFKTFPTNSPLRPGAYIYVDIGNTSWEGIYSGRIEKNGALNLPLSQTVINGTYSFLVYSPDAAPISLSTNVSSNVAAGLSSYEGWLFVLGSQVKKKRVFKVTEVEMDEEGEVTVRAIEHPTLADGRSKITNVTNLSGTQTEPITKKEPIRTSLSLPTSPASLFEVLD